jgi:hypothetical protein
MIEKVCSHQPLGQRRLQETNVIKGIIPSINIKASAR